MNQSSQTWQRSTYHWASTNLQALFSWNYLSQASRLIITYFRSKRIFHFPWFRSHFTNRSKITSVGDDQSIAIEVPLGVPLPGTTILFNSYKWSPRLSAGKMLLFCTPTILRFITHPKTLVTLNNTSMMNWDQCQKGSPEIPLFLTCRNVVLSSLEVHKSKNEFRKFRFKATAQEYHMVTIILIHSLTIPRIECQ